MKPPSEKLYKVLWNRMLSLGVTGPDCFIPGHFEEFKRGGIMVVVDSKTSGRDLTVISEHDCFFRALKNKLKP